MEEKLIPITEKTGDHYEIAMFCALLSNKENFLVHRGVAYWATATHYSTLKTPLSIDGIVHYRNGFHRYTHILWINNQQK